MPSYLKQLRQGQNGQSLVEILIGLAIGALLIGTATIGIVFVLKSSTTNENLGSGVDLTKGLLDNVRTFAASSWTGLTGLAHGTSSTYFIVASGTNLFAVPGAEGVLGNDVQNGLVGHWGFDEGTGTITYDESGNGNNGTLVNGPTWQSGSNCIVGNCLSFNGTNYVQIGGQNSLGTSNQPYTILLWFKANSVSGGVLMHESSQNNGGGWCLPTIGFTSSGNLSVQSWNGGSVNATMSTTATTGAWTQVAEIWDPVGGLRLYVNGILGASSTMTNYSASGVPNYIWPAWGATGIGCSSGQIYKANFNGQIDDVRVYNRALSATEVKQLYNSQAFSRYFYVQDVCRTNDASSSIVGNPPCSGSNWDDPLTQQVTAVTQWLAGAATDNTSLTTYLTDYRNFTLRQTDWSGGSGQTGPLTIPNTQYASGTNVTGTSTLGSFQIQNLTQQ